MAESKNSVHEHTFNVALGEILEKQRSGWKGCLAVENPGSISGGRQADILVYPADMNPVIVECAYQGTPNIDGDAIGRLGCKETKYDRVIMTAIALRIPNPVRKMKNSAAVREWLKKGGELEYAFYSSVKPGQADKLGEEIEHVRYPAGNGYIKGNIGDLATLIELASTPDKKINEVADRVVRAVRGKGMLLFDKLPDNVKKNIARKLGQPMAAYAMCVAVCVWLNALLLHARLATAGASIPGIEHPKAGNINLRWLKNQWEAIIAVDYVSVFEPALEVLMQMTGHESVVDLVFKDILDEVEAIQGLRMGTVADISSDIFPQMAGDRKTTAAFYTLPKVAELLAGMAFNLIPDNGNDIKIADFACGTGALLKASYRQICRRAEQKGCDMKTVHKKYMEECLHGSDIQPIAAHLTVAGLAAMNPLAMYDHSNILYTSLGGGKTGSLELLATNTLDNLYDKRKKHEFVANDNAFDLCIMNPPYTMTHGQKNQKTQKNQARGGVTAFGVEALTPQETAWSQKTLKGYLKKSFGNMQAGMASAFCLLADKKLKENGVLAFVLPQTAAGTESWRKWRAEMLRKFSDIIIIAGVPFSADANMQEMLVCARKNGSKSNGNVKVVYLHHAPKNFIESNEMARAMRNLKPGRMGIGKEIFATCAQISPQPGDPWGAVGARDLSVLEMAAKLIKGSVTLPLTGKSVPLPIAMKPLSDCVEIGPSETLIGHLDGVVLPRGAFCFREIRGRMGANFSLWAANCATQTKLMCAPTHSGDAVEGKENAVENMLARGSILFISRELRMNSQKLASAMTAERCMGGSSWTALQFKRKSVYHAYCLWLNSILGLIARWQHAGRQLRGKARIHIRQTKTFPCPDFAADTAAAKYAVKIAGKKFKELAKLDLHPCAMAWKDPVRQKIDRAVLDMLGLKISEKEMQEIRKRWCSEPSVHGGNREILRALTADKIL